GPLREGSGPQEEEPMRMAIPAALLLTAAPAFAQSNLGNTQKDSATSDVQRNKEDSSQTANSSSTSATPSSDSSSASKSWDSSASVGDSGATADSRASSSSPSKARSVDEVRKDKQKGIARARAAKRQREKSGAEHWDPRSPS